MTIIASTQNKRMVFFEVYNSFYTTITDLIKKTMSLEIDVLSYYGLEQWTKHYRIE